MTQLEQEKPQELVEGVANYNPIVAKRNELNGADVLQIWMKLSDNQIETLFLQGYNFDLKFIKSLQQNDRYPVPDPNSWKPGKNFEGALYVGTRKLSDGTLQTVYLKHDGWFTTPEDITNCLPLKDNAGNIEQDGNGYIFLDATAAKAREAGTSVSSFVGTFSGGKTRKHGKRKSRKSKRRYRK